MSIGDYSYTFMFIYSIQTVTWKGHIGANLIQFLKIHSSITERQFHA